MPRGPVKRRKVITCADVIKVQTLIEHCLKHYMNKEEVVQALQNELEIEPDFTKLVWQKLEEENREFFEPYLKCMEEKKPLMALPIFASHPIFDESHNHHAVLSQSQSNSGFDRKHNHHALLSQSNSEFDKSYNHAVLSQPKSEFEQSHNHAVLSQPNSEFDRSHVILSQPNFNEGLSSTLTSLPIFDGSYNPPVPLEPNSNLGSAGIGSLPTFDGSHNTLVLSQPNYNLGSTEIWSLPSFDGPHNPAISAQPNFNLGSTEIGSQPSFDAPHNLAVLAQPLNGNGFASLPTVGFDGSHNSAVLSQPDLEVPPKCNYTGERIQPLMLTNMQHPGYTNSFDLHPSMHGVAYGNGNGNGNGNWINDPSRMFFNQGQDMGFMQGINGEIIESRPQFAPLNGKIPFSNQSYGFGIPLN